ncbi:MAG TPA: hypothetical protein VFP47_01115, partial [Pyrinomonadaceae bacterium]|nr:hypothetical protein [Pyrinomonadaceae bacterium]
ILTKPFQSIRRLIDRVGSLVSSPSVEKERPTAELPRVEEPEEEPALMDTHELEVTTKDTRPLKDAVIPTGSLPREENMEPGVTEDSADVLLDLGDIDTVRASSEDDEFVLDLDEDVASPSYEPRYEPPQVRAFVEPQVKEAAAAVGAYESTYQPEVQSSFADTQEVPPYVSDVAVVEPEAEPETTFAEPAPAPAAVPVSGTSLTADQLSPEMIDAIARRAVELMSDKVIREIAWEVVPDLAELLIKRQLEEKESQAK